VFIAQMRTKSKKKGMSTDISSFFSIFTLGGSRFFYDSSLNIIIWDGITLRIKKSKSTKKQNEKEEYE
jgi:hypothetical protein